MFAGEETTTLGKSIIVPSVQELIKGHNLTEVPERYVQHEQHQPDLESDDVVQVPIIDMEALVAGHGMELHSLHSACQEWGFFQLINHGLSSSLLEKCKVGVHEFFNLPFEEKKKYWQTATDFEGFGQAFVFSEEQKIDWADMFYITTFPEHERKCHLFPILPLPFRDMIENYSAEMRNLAIKILDSMARALEIDAELVREMFGEGQQMMRMNYYPPCPEPDKVIGLTSHSDAVALTILLQVNDMDGLQIMKDGKWVTVKPRHDALIVNVGDMMEIVSNGIYRSVLHRAVANASRERLSVGTFYSPSFNKEIGPINELISTKSPARFRSIKIVDYWKEFFTRPLNGRSYIDCMRIKDID